MVAVLYRTNAQSRVIEDALMRSGMAYKVVGGVRFYERKGNQGRARVHEAAAEPTR